jgi:hypothetical protein
VSHPEKSHYTLIFTDELGLVSRFLEVSVGWYGEKLLVVSI